MQRLERQTLTLVSPELVVDGVRIERFRVEFSWVEVARFQTTYTAIWSVEDQDGGWIQTAEILHDEYGFRKEVETIKADWGMVEA